MQYLMQWQVYHRTERKIDPSVANEFISDMQINLGCTKQLLASERGTKFQEGINPFQHYIKTFWKEAQNSQYFLPVHNTVLCFCEVT